MLRTHYIGELSGNEENISLAGWIRNIRGHGKIMFVFLADRDGQIQITVKDDLIKDFKSLSREDVVSVKGSVKKNDKAPNGMELIPSSIEVLNRSEKPLPLETDSKIESNLDTRLDNRFLDVRNPKVMSIFRIKDMIQRHFIRHFEDKGFVLVNTPEIVAAATEGGTDLFPISYFEKEAFLVQSPQLYKQILMASGLDKVMIQCPVFRAEEHDTSFHVNESIQMDIEQAFVRNEDEVLKHMKEFILSLYQKINDSCSKELKNLGRDIKVPEKIEQITYDEALKIVNKKSKELEWGDDFTPEMQRTINKEFEPVIVTKWPTDIRSFYSMPEPGNEKICRSYDMLINGIEVSSGAQRIHKNDELVNEMKSRGMNPENFEFYINAFKYGMPPHAGWSFGLDRLTMVMTGMKNIRECIMFPRDRKRLTP